MPTMQNSRDALRTEIQNQVRDAVRAASQGAAQAAQDAKAAKDAGQAGRAAPVAPIALPPIPPGGGRLVIQEKDGQTVITSAALPPEILPLAQMAKDTALGLMGILAVIVIVGPFARMFARRMGKRDELNAAGQNANQLQSQLLQLQQSVDAMSLEVERISESQRFQSKLLNERK
jgi:hypothetical protein